MAIRLYNDNQDTKISSKTGAISLYSPEDRKKVDETLATPIIFAPKAEPVEEKSFFDKSKALIGKVATSVGNVLNKLQQKGDTADFQMRELLSGKASVKVDPITGQKKYTTDKLEAFNNAPDPETRSVILKDSQKNIPIVKFLNSGTGRKITNAVAENTSNIPLKTWAAVKSIGDETYDEAYSALLAKSKDPSNTRFEKILYGLQDSGVQSAVGVLLGLGATVASRGKIKPQIITAPYFAAISAAGEQQDKGEITSLGNIVIDTIGDTILSGVAESALKSIIKDGGETALRTILKQTGKGFVTEGSTEVSQSLLKYVNDYKNAKTEEEKQAVVEKVANYVNNGGIVDEFLIGGLSGGIITGAAAGVGGAVNPSLQSDEEDGQDKTPPPPGSGGSGQRTIEFNTNFSEVRDEITSLRNHIAENPSDENAVTRLSVLEENLSDYLDSVKDRPVFVSDDTQEAPLAVVETAKFPDGKFTFSYKAATGNNAVEQPFIVTQTFATQEKATEAGKKAILKWATTKLKSDPNSTEAEKLNTIVQEIKQEGSSEKGPVEPQNKGKKSLVNRNIQEKVGRTKKGGYTLNKYSRKGNTVGRATVAFRRSPKNGKIYMEVELKGDRVLRMSLESAKKKYETTDRNEIARRAVNGIKDPVTKKWTYQQSDTPVIKNKTQNQVEKKPVVTEGEVKKSKAFARVQERLGEYADLDSSYNKLNLAKDTANALEFIRQNPKDARKIALGMMSAPEGITETAISIALAEQAGFEKDYELQAQLERSRSLRQTRRGQEIVSERGRFNENSAHHFMSQVIAARYDILGKKFIYRAKNGKIESRSQVAQAKLAEGTESVKRTVKRKLSPVELAQSVIEQLTC